MKISRNSWHYKVACLGGGIPRTRDICAYTSDVFTGLVGIGVLTIIAGYSLFVIGNVIAWIAAILVNGVFIEPNFFTMMGIFFFVITFPIILLLGYILNRHFKDKKPEPSFIRTAYLSWKNKWCTKIEVVD